MALLLGGVDREELNRCRVFDFRGGSGDQLAGKPIEIEQNFVTRHALFFGDGVAPDQRRITAEPGEIGFADQHATELGLVTEIM